MSDNKQEKNTESEKTTKPEKTTVKPKKVWRDRVLGLGVIALGLGVAYYYNVAGVQGYTDMFKDNDMMLSNPDDTEIKNREDLAKKIILGAEATAIIEEQNAPLIPSETELMVISQIDSLQDKITELEQRLKDKDTTALDSRLETIESQVSKMGRDKNNQGIAFTILQLKMQIDMGQPFAQELAILEAMLQGNNKNLAHVQSLSKYAITGIPTQKDLAIQFQEMTKPQNIAQVIPEGTSWTDKLWIKARSFVSVKKLDDSASREEKSLMASIDKAKELIAINDLPMAVTLLEQQKNLSEAMQVWLGKAQARVDADKSINSLMSDAVVLFSSERLMQ